MNSRIDYQVNPKEHLYFYIRLFLSFGLYYLLYWSVLTTLKSESTQAKTLIIFYIYAGIILLYVFIRFGILIGHLKGNAIKLSKNQFPEIYKIAEDQSELLGLKFVPDVYIMQSGGVLNAFAAKFLGRNYIVLFSEIVETSIEQDKNILEFIIGHELGHIKRNHMFKSLILLPSYLIPFLGAAYSRACEYTCDNIGNALCPAGVKGGLLVLASGKSIYKNVNIKAYLTQVETEGGFWRWFAEKCSSHPHLTKRLACFININDIPNYVKTIVSVEKKEEDHNKYMPK
jgi:Zn-dependent protease with chaperone function